MLNRLWRTATALRVLAWPLAAALLAPAAMAQSKDAGAAAYKQLQQMQNDPQYQKMMNDPQVREAMAQAMKNSGQTPAVKGGVARTGMPKRDTARLATVSRVAPTDAQLREYLPKVHAAVLNRLPADQRASVNGLIAQLKADSPGSLEAAASAAWMLGHPDLGVVLMGQAAIDHPGKANTLNNYAAFLTMLGAEPQAIAILQNLAQKFPSDGTVQANLGQAWFGLGEVTEAKKHLQSAVRLFPGCTQANDTLADIAEAGGDKAGETEALQKSIESSYSVEKADRLEKLGKKIPPDKIPWRVHFPQDPMGLEKFTVPAFCKGVADARDCETRWQVFKDEISARMESLTAKDTRLRQQINERATKASARATKPNASMADMMAAANQMMNATGLGELSKSPMTRIAKPRFAAAMDELGKVSQKWAADNANTKQMIVAIQQKYSAKRNAIESRYQPMFGEGASPGIEEQYCSEIDQLENAESDEMNPVLEASYTAMRPRILRAYNDYVYYAQFENDDLAFQELKTHQQLMFLAWLGSVHGAPFEGSRCTKRTAKKQSTVLQDFYDVHCEHIISFSVPKIGSFDVHCNKMTTNLNLSFNVGGASIGFKSTTTENLDTEQFIKGRVELGTTIGADAPVGPVKAGASAEGTGFVEFDDHGVTNVGGSLSGSAGVGPATVTVGSDVSWTSGASGSGSATLGGITVGKF